ncbi:unnamed protein product [Camellia sinensis]
MYCGVWITSRVVRVRYRFREVQALVDPLRPSSLPRSSQKANAKEADQVSDQFQSASISDATASSGGSTSKQEVKHLPGGKIKRKCGSTSKQEVKHLPGGKIKKKDKQEVVIEKVVRNRRKCITTVKGVNFLGPTKREQIDVQGDISYDIVEFITDSWPDAYDHVMERKFRHDEI